MSVQSTSPATGAAAGDAPGFRPLYRQAYDLLAARIHKGTWRPSQALPSEQALAAELGVSHGTVRKALDALVADKLVERRQGKGTFVIEQTPERALFQFFRISRANGDRVTPASADTATIRRTPTPDEAVALALLANAEVFSVDRVRTVDGAPAIRESLVVSAERFPDLDQHAPLPNAIYVLYQQAYGVMVSEAREAVQAVAADAVDAQCLGVARGAPLLQIRRLAVDFQGHPLELRYSRCRTTDLAYSVTLK